MYRLVFRFGTVKYSWAEAWMSKDGVSATEIGDIVDKYVSLRLKMLPLSAQFISARVSFTPDATIITPGRRQSRILKPGSNEFPAEGKNLVLGEKGTFGAETATKTWEHLRSALEYRIGLPEERSATRYLAGVPDDLGITLSGSILMTRNPDWKAAWDNWRAYVRQNLRIIGRTTTIDDPLTPVLGLTRKTEGILYMGIIFSTFAPFEWALGQKISIAGFRRFRSSPGLSINGNYHIQEIVSNSPTTGFTTVYLRELTTVSPTEIKVLGTVRRNRKTPLSMAFISPVELGIHKRGNSQSGSRGRRLTRETLDP